MIAEYPWPRTPQAAAHEKVLRLYDAALARAEAAERDADRETKRALEAEYQCSEHSRIGDGYWDRMMSAESRLAEATALLDTAEPKTCDYALCDGADCCLPAQAAEPERPNDGRSGRCGIRVSGHHWCTLDHGHPGGHSTDEHPDTIALRECRAELLRQCRATAAQTAALESARAERDTVNEMCAGLRRQTCEDAAELRTALARIGEAIADEKRDAASLEACEKHLSIVIEARDEACAKVESLDEQWHEACAERDTALARIAELESRCADAEQNEAALSRAALDHAMSAGKALARIAELEAQYRTLLSDYEEARYPETVETQAELNRLREHGFQHMARIAELEAIKPLLDAEKLTAAETRISKAVEELNYALPHLEKHEMWAPVKRALEALR